MAKRIVFCADGTWNTPHGPGAFPADTNVRKLFLAVEENAEQLKYYDSGVGTDGSPFEHFFGGAMGQGLFQKIQDGYAFLSYVWDPGDELFIFGFSRGAYTARSLAGMIALCGVPTRNLDNQAVSRIFACYRTTGPAQRARLKAELTGAYSLAAATVHMVGVWDTVGALGVPGHLFSAFDQAKYGFLDTSLNPCIENAFHAVSIDERRASFQPTLWTDEHGLARPNDAHLQQVWFPGVHCDVGGSYAECALSNISLRWMIDRARACGLVFDEAAVAASLRPTPFDPSGPQHDEWRLIPWGLPEHRSIAKDAVLSNTVALRNPAGAPYKPPNLTQPVGAYASVEVIPEGELGAAPHTS